MPTNDASGVPTPFPEANGKARRASVEERRVEGGGDASSPGVETAPSEVFSRSATVTRRRGGAANESAAVVGMSRAPKDIFRATREGVGVSASSRARRADDGGGARVAVVGSSPRSAVRARWSPPVNRPSRPNVVGVATTGLCGRDAIERGTGGSRSSARGSCVGVRVVVVAATRARSRRTRENAGALDGGDAAEGRVEGFLALLATAAAAAASMFRPRGPAAGGRTTGQRGAGTSERMDG